MYEQNNPSQYSSAQTGITPTFYGKVMTFFAAAIFMSALGTYLAVTYFMSYFIAMPWLQFAFYALELGIIFTARSWSQKRPLNRILFGAFALITGITIAPLIAILASTPEGVSIITKALLATACMFTATALVGWTTKKDLSGLRGFLTMSLIGMIIVSIMGIFMPWGNTFELVFSGFGVILFSAFTIYDLQKIKKYPEDRYIEAALNLYLDIFNMFLMILRFMIALSGRD